MTKKRNISSSKKKVKKTNIKKRKLIKGGNKETRKSKKNKKKTQKATTIKRHNKKTRKIQKGGGRKELLKTLLEKDGKKNISDEDINRLDGIITNIKIKIEVKKSVEKEQTKYLNNWIAYMFYNILPQKLKEIITLLKLGMFNISLKREIKEYIEKYTLDNSPTIENYNNNLYRTISNIMKNKNKEILNEAEIKKVIDDIRQTIINFQNQGFDIKQQLTKKIIAGIKQYKYKYTFIKYKSQNSSNEQIKNKFTDLYENIWNQRSDNDKQFLRDIFTTVP